MGLSNEELVKKAVITTDALATAGKLNPAQSERFLDYVEDESVLKNNARQIRFRNEQLDIDKIGIGARVSMAKTEATDPSLRRGVTTSKVSLIPKEVITPFEVSKLFNDHSIEGDSVEDHIVSLMAKQTSNDLEELYINGNALVPAVLESDYRSGGSTSQYVADKFLGLFDGWSKIAEGANVVDAAGANVGLSIFGSMLRAMPTKFRRNKTQLRWFISPDLWQLYLEKLATRATALGDAAAAGSELGPFGVQAVPVPLWDLYPKTVKHVVLNGTTAVSLGFAPVQNEVVTATTLDVIPTTPFVKDTDYTIDYSAGTIARLGAGSIGDGDTVKVTFQTNPGIILTHQANFIVGVGMDIAIESDYDIYRRVSQYAIHTRVACQFEELTAIVFGKNIGDSV
jgi:hypothetical protein